MSNKRYIKKLALAIALLLNTGLIPEVYAQAPASALSPNVPINSYAYDYLEKLDGLGYLQDMRTGSKPYTRMQFAKWLVQIEAAMKAEADVPPYAVKLVDELQADFAGELDYLSGKQADSGLSLKEARLEYTHYSGDSLKENRTKATFQPLNTYNNGYRYGENSNGVASLRLESSPDKHFAAAIAPRFSVNSDESDLSIESAYAKTRLNNVEFQIGKDAMWWGQGSHGSLLLTNNAEPLTMIKISNIEPMKPPGFLKFLGKTNTTFMLAQMEDERTDVNHPSFIGLRKDFQPNSNFTFAMARTSIIGGEGHGLNGSDWLDFITGTNAGSAAEDKWNSIAGLDFRWRLPQLGNVQIYGELYGEDQTTKWGFFPWPSQQAKLIGLYVPRLSPSGDWDAHFELAHTQPSWYNHWVYTDGYTYKGDIMGDAMGNEADRYYARLTHYNVCGAQISFNYERMEQQYNDPATQYIDSFWLTGRTKIANSTYLNGSVGVARIKNANLDDGSIEHNKMVSVSLTKQY